MSTNSICQGQLGALLWGEVLSDEREIGFAHTSFKWINNAKGNAGVTVVIVGIRNIKNDKKYIYSNSLKKKK